MFQIYESGLRQYRNFAGRPAGAHILLGVARFLTAHSPTVRARGQTYDIAARLLRGESCTGKTNSPAEACPRGHNHTGGISPGCLVSKVGHDLGGEPLHGVIDVVGRFSVQLRDAEGVNHKGSHAGVAEPPHVVDDLLCGA